MPLPYLLLDIDGVLVPFPDSHGTIPATHTCHKVVPSGRDPADPVTVWLNRAHGPMLKDLFCTGLVIPVRCTSRRGDATTLIGPLLGLPCVRCDQAIRPGEPYDTHIHHGATLAGCTNYSHRTCAGLRVPPPVVPYGDTSAR